MTNPISDLYGDQPDFEPTELETEQAASILRLETELERLRTQAEAPETGAVEQPVPGTDANLEKERQAAQLAVRNATSRDEAWKALEEYNRLTEQAAAQHYGVQELRPVHEVMSPEAAREFVAKAAAESSNSREYFEKLRSAGLATPGFEEA